MIGSLSLASVILTASLLLVMANEFPVFPQRLVDFSSALSRRRRDRSIFIVFVISTLVIATGLHVVSPFPIYLEITMENGQ